MKKSFKNFFSILLLFIILFTNTLPLYAAEKPFAGKNAEVINGEEGRYKVTVSVPGKTEKILHNEVILMLDASDSQGANWTSVKESIMTIARAVLPQTLSNRKKATMAITIMGFGVSGKTVLQDIVSIDELEQKLNALPTNDAFLNGQSATNCEVGFTHIQDYLTNHKDDIRDAFVIYVSDGKSNASEELIDLQFWPENPAWWFGGYKQLEPLVKFLFRGGKVQGHPYECEFYWLLDGKDTVNATDSVLGYTRENIIEKFLEQNTVLNKINSIENKISSATSQTEVEQLTLEKQSWDQINSRFLPDTNGITKYIYAGNSTIPATTKEQEQMLIDLLKEDIDGLFNKMWTDMSEVIPATDLRTGESVSWPKWRVWIDTLWSDVYSYSNLNYQTGKYSCSTIEAAFLKYDSDFCGRTVRWTEHVSLAFYFAFLGRSAVDKHSSPQTAGIRAAAACDTLAAMSEVGKIYLIGYGNWAKDSWMNPNRATKYETGNYVKASNASFYSSSSITAISEALKEIVPDIVSTSHTDVKITDFMSKWVRLDLDSIKIFKDDVCICKYNYNEETGVGEHEWLIPEADRPTEKIPITVTVVKATDYTAGGKEVIGNQSGDIYKIIWQVKDDTILVSDNYSLVYEVIIDENEPGFVAGTKYPTNGETIEEFVDPKGELKSLSIEVPKVPTREIIQPSTGEAQPSTPQPEVQNVIHAKNPTTGDINISLIIFIMIMSYITFIITYKLQSKNKNDNK